MHEKTVLAIDPGTSKCGLAVVHRDAVGTLDLRWRRIAQTSEVVEAVEEAREIAPFSLIVVGAGTHSKEIVARIREKHPGTGILVVDEKDTTLRAREIYWEHHARRGWRRIVPATLQVPPEPVDDFVAFILAERVLQDA